jgi:hypothetical protein
MGGRHANPRHTATRERPSGHCHLVGKDPGRADHLTPIEHGQRPIELGSLLDHGELFVRGERATKRAAKQRDVGALLLGPDRPELKSCR